MKKQIPISNKHEAREGERERERERDEETNTNIKHEAREGERERELLEVFLKAGKLPNSDDSEWQEQDPEKIPHP